MGNSRRGLRTIPLALLLAFPAPRLLAQTAAPAVTPAAASGVPANADQQAVPAVPCPSPALPIGAVIIERHDVFSTDEAHISRRLAHAANAFHVVTRDPVVLRELLFREGQPCDAEALAQSERNLRALGLFRRVEIRTSPPRDGRVDVTVRTEDAWSLRSGVDVSREGGFTSWDLRLADTNAGGVGLGVGLRRRHGFERDVTTFSFQHARAFGTRERVVAEVDRRSDGEATRLELSRPFFAIDSRWGHELSYDATGDHLRVYDHGDVAGEYARQARDVGLGVALRLAAPSALSALSAWRLSTGYRFTAREYALLAGSPSPGSATPPSHRWGGPSMDIHFIQHAFIKRRGLLVPDKDVDLNLGLTADVGLLLSVPAAGPRTTARTLISGAVSKGWSVPGGGVAIAGTGGGIQLGGADIARGDAWASMRAWWSVSPTRVRAALAEVRALVNAEPGSRYYLGGSPGLRGFRQNAFAGTRTALLVVEERKYFRWTPAGLVRPGVVAFVEAGATGGLPAAAAGAAADAGIGLRLALLRTAASSAIRLDVAYPLTAEAGRQRRPQLVVGYRGDF